MIQGLATGGATWCYFVVVAERGPGFLSTINYLIPAVAFVAGTVFLAEPWGWEHLLALALILVGGNTGQEALTKTQCTIAHQFTPARIAFKMRHAVLVMVANDAISGFEDQ